MLDFPRGGSYYGDAAAHLTSSVLCHKFYCRILKHFYVASYPEQNQMRLDNTLALWEMFECDKT